MPAFPAAALRHRRGSARCAPSEGALAPALAELPRRNLRAEAHWLVSEGRRRLTPFLCFHGAASNARSPGGRAVHHGNGAPSSSPSASRLRQRAGSPSQSPSGRAPTGGKLTAAGRCGCGWRARWRLSRHCGSAAASSHSHHPVARHTAVHDSIAREVHADPTSSTVDGK